MSAVPSEVLREFSRIVELAQSQSSVDEEEVAELRRERDALRATVAHLRGTNARVPEQLQPVLDRAVWNEGGRSEPETEVC